MKYYISKNRLSSKIAVVLFALSLLYCAVNYLFASPVSGAVEICKYLLVPLLACALYIVTVLLIGKTAPWFSFLPMVLSFTFFIILSYDISNDGWATTITYVLYVCVFIVYAMTMFGLLKVNARMICRIVIALPLFYRILICIYVFVLSEGLYKGQSVALAPYLLEILMLGGIFCTGLSLRHKKTYYHNSKEKSPEAKSES